MHVPMAKVEIIGPKKLFFDVVTAVHKLGSLHIEDLSKKTIGEEALVEQMEADASQTEQKTELENLLVRINAIISEMEPPSKKLKAEEKEKIYGETWRESAKELAKEINEVILEIESRTVDLAAKKNELEVENSLLAKYEPILEKIQPLAKQIVTTEGFDSIALLVQSRYKGALKSLEEELNKITKKQSEIVSTDVDEETTAAIVIYNKLYKEPVHKFLSMENVNEIRLPEDLADQPFDSAYDSVKKRREELPTQLKEINSNMDELSDRWYYRLNAIKNVLIDKVAQLEAIPKFGRTEYAFVVTGWVPKDQISTVEEVITKQFGRDVIVAPLKLSHEELGEAPVSLKNPKWAEPFQFFYKLVKPPKYGTIDPTPFVAVFFPILFGLIVGDVGYGIVIFLIAWLLRKKFKDSLFIYALASIAWISSISAMFFGTFVFFEGFGNIPELIVEKLFEVKPPYFHIGPIGWPIVRLAVGGSPEEAKTSFFTLLALAIGTGIIHLALGFVLGVVNGIKEHNMKHVYEKAGYLLFFMSGTVVVVCFMLKASVLAMIFAVLAFVGFIGIAYGGSIKGIIEIFGTIANTFTYIRLLALGIAGVALALATNIIAAKLGALGPIAMLGGLILAIILHGVNIIVSVLSPSIHSLRLHLVEQFSKFYETAPAEYTPFKKTGGE